MPRRKKKGGVFLGLFVRGKYKEEIATEAQSLKDGLERAADKVFKGPGKRN